MHKRENKTVGKMSVQKFLQRVCDMLETADEFTMRVQPIGDDAVQLEITWTPDPKRTKGNATYGQTKNE